MAAPVSTPKTVRHPKAPIMKLPVSGARIGEMLTMSIRRDMMRVASCPVRMASFVFINHYALSPTLFSLCFTLNAASFFAFSQMTARLTARFGLAPVIRVAVSGFASPLKNPLALARVS